MNVCTETIEKKLFLTLERKRRKKRPGFSGYENFPVKFFVYGCPQVNFQFTFLNGYRTNKLLQ